MPNVHLTDSVSEKINRDIGEHNQTLNGIMLGVLVLFIGGLWTYYLGFQGLILVLGGIFLIVISVMSHKSNSKKYHYR